MSPLGKRWIGLIPVALLAAAVVACGGSTTNEGGGGGAATATTAPTNAPSTGGGEPREIEVLMVDNAFEPTEIRLKVGETARITAKNGGVAIHNMHVLSAATEGKDFASVPIVNPGEESTFEVQFSTAGTFKFQCDFHLPGMVGEIIVD